MQEADEKIAELVADIVREQRHWKYLSQNGCQDPFWPDGCNMNLTRNHILYDKQCIAELCSETGCAVPPEYYIPTPPEVDNNYMANLKQKERVLRLRRFNDDLTTKKVAYNDKQLSLI